MQHNLNGPNFVVDSGSDSLEASLSLGKMLLHGGDLGGTKLAVIALIDANRWRRRLGTTRPEEGEFAAAFALTTRGHAQELGLSIVADMDEAFRLASEGPEADRGALPTSEKVRGLLMALDAAADRTANATPLVTTSVHSASVSESPFFHPVWVEAPSSHRPTAPPHSRETAFLAVVTAHREQVAALVAKLPSCSQRYMVAVVGPTAHEIASSIGNPNVFAVDLSNEQATETSLDRMEDFGADIIVAVDTIAQWDLSQTLENVASNNGLCELLFLVAQRRVSQLRHGTVELWGLFPDAWNGVVHPSSGAIAGFLKSVNREFPAARTGTICTRGISLGNALERLLGERLAADREQEIAYDATLRLVRRLRPMSRSGTPLHR